MPSFPTHREHTTIVPPAKARDWMFDLEADDHAHPDFQNMQNKVPMKPGDGRKMVSKTATQIVVEDTLGGRTMRVTSTKEGADAVKVHGESKDATFDSTIRFLPDGQGGTRIVNDGMMHTPGVGGWIFYLFLKDKFMKFFEEDTGLHVKHMEQEWTTKPW